MLINVAASAALSVVALPGCLKFFAAGAELADGLFR